MLKILEGSDFFIQEFLQQHIESKFKGCDERRLKYSILRNPSALSSITNVSSIGLDDRVIIWNFENFKKFESFAPYVVPKGTDIFVIGQKIDKRLVVIKDFLSYNAEHKIFKDLYPNQIESWILDRSKKMKLKIQPEATKMIALLYGVNLGEILKYLEELKELNVIITKDIVLKSASFVNKFSIFELQDEVFSKRFNKSLYILTKLIKDGEQPFLIMRYFINQFDKLITIRTNDEGLIEDLKLHSYVVKKLKESRWTLYQCKKALDILRNCENSFLKGGDSNFIEYLIKRCIFNLCKI